MQVVLVMFRADGERRSFSLPREMTVVGRREDCDLRIPLSDVSRKHCRIVKEESTLRVEDLGSSNGTYHNGQRVQEAHVGAGDTIQVGPVVFVAQLDGVPAEDELQPFTAHAAAALDASAQGAEVVDADQLEEVLDETPALEAADQAQTIAGAESGNGFDPMEVLGQEEEHDADDFVDFNITEEEVAADDDAQVNINFDDPTEAQQPGGRA